MVSEMVPLCHLVEGEGSDLFVAGALLPKFEPATRMGCACLAVALGVPALSFLFLFLRALGSLGLGRYVVGSVRIEEKRKREVMALGFSRP